jgi:hypothetical protein
MQEQDIKRGHFKNIEGEKLDELIKEVFGDYEKEGDKYVIRYGALQPFTTWIKDKSTLCIDTQMQPDVDEGTAIDTRKKYNLYMERATGFSAKQRNKRLQKKLKEGKI